MTRFDRRIHPVVVLVAHAFAASVVGVHDIGHLAASLALATVAGSAILLVLYAIAMRFKNYRDRSGGLDLRHKLVVYPVLAVGYPLDIALNWTYMALLFWDAAREATVMARLERYVNERAYRATWRQELAWAIGRELNQWGAGHVERKLRDD